MLSLKEVLREIAFSEKLFYVYVLYKPCGTPFYVGKAKAREKSDRIQIFQRISNHEIEARNGENWERKYSHNRHKLNTIRKIWSQGSEVFYSVDSWHDTEEACYAREKELINSLGRKTTGNGPLTNITEGGEKEMATVSEETRKKISETLKEYYRDHPEALEAMSERGKVQFSSEEERERMRRQNAVNKNHEYLARWRKENPDGHAENGKVHSEWLKEWHSTEEGKEITKQAAEKRNTKFRTEEHRKHMAEKTAQYIRKNPEAFKANREKAKQSTRANLLAKQVIFLTVQERLFAAGLIQKKETQISFVRFSKWKKAGLVTEEELKSLERVKNADPI